MPLASLEMSPFVNFDPRLAHSKLSVMVFQKVPVLTFGRHAGTDLTDLLFEWGLTVDNVLEENIFGVQSRDLPESVDDVFKLAHVGVC